MRPIAGKPVLLSPKEPAQANAGLVSTPGSNLPSLAPIAAIFCSMSASRFYASANSSSSPPTMIRTPREVRR